jgi:hypothetical protein
LKRRRPGSHALFKRESSGLSCLSSGGHPDLFHSCVYPLIPITICLFGPEKPPAG